MLWEQKRDLFMCGQSTLAIERLEGALEQARDYGLLGDNILNSGFNFDIEVYPGAGAFVCGESTALMYSLEGRRGMPRIKPPALPNRDCGAYPLTLITLRPLPMSLPSFSMGESGFRILEPRGVQAPRFLHSPAL